jgi:predicted transcriptional regulator
MGERRAHGTLESEVMATVAASAEPVTVRDVRTAVDAELSYTAVHTILSRLAEKGMVERTRSGRGFAYRPADGAATVVAAQMDALLQRGPSRSAVLRSFLSTLSPEDEHDLRAWLAGRTDRPGRAPAGGRAGGGPG